MNPVQALGLGLAEASRSQDSVTATGSLDVKRYGRLLRARQLVGVRGVGVAYDGLYYVKSVTSTITRTGDFKQQFELTRNGLISITPRIPV
jgi:phage protein D